MNLIFQGPYDIPSHQSEAHNNDVLSVRNTFLALGAPSVSEDDFTRLFKGPFGELLLFLSLQMKGRKRVAQDRHLIQEIKSHSRHPGRQLEDADSYSQLKKSKSDFNKALKGASVLQMQLKAQLVELEEADTRIIYLKQVIQEKRRAALLLRVLDERERVRIRRFQGLVKTIDKLRTASLDTSSTAITLPWQPRSLISFKTGISLLPKVSLTQEITSNLHAYHLRLRRLKELEYEPSLEIVSRLRIRLTNKIQADQIQATIERLCKVARVKAKRKIRCHDTAWSILSCVSKEQLSANAREIASRKQELQRLSHNAIILGFLCEHLITSLSVFLEQTSPVLRSSLRDSIPIAKGHIDVQRLVAIPQFNDLPKRRKTLSFIEEVCKACGVSNVQESETVLRVVEGMIERADQQSSYLVTVRALNVPPKSSQEEVLLGGYQTGYQSVEERAQTLLMRKVGKAALGNSIINEIDTLMKDAQTLTGS